MIVGFRLVQSRVGREERLPILSHRLVGEHLIDLRDRCPLLQRLDQRPRVIANLPFPLTVDSGNFRLQSGSYQLEFRGTDFGAVDHGQDRIRRNVVPEIDMHGVDSAFDERIDVSEPVFVQNDLAGKPGERGHLLLPNRFDLQAGCRPFFTRQRYRAFSSVPPMAVLLLLLAIFRFRRRNSLSTPPPSRTGSSDHYAAHQGDRPQPSASAVALRAVRCLSRIVHRATSSYR